MLTHRRSSLSLLLALLVGLLIVGVGLATGFFIGIKPLYLGLALGAVPMLVYFFTNFEQAVIGLLILRSSLSGLSGLQIPSAYALALDALTLLYVTVMLLTGRKVKCDRFWWIFALWVILQALWLILLPLGGLGLDASFLGEGIREWVRRFTFLMVYLLVIQLQDRLHPQRVITLLLFSLIVPVTVGLMQIPSGDRIQGTIGHPNSFATYLSFMIALAWWRLNLAQKRLPWMLLLGLLSFAYVNTRSLAALVTAGVLILVLNASKLNPIRIVGGVILFSIVLVLFANTGGGQERLSELFETPLFNRDLDISRTMILAVGDGNSFNWRITHWYYLIQSWQNYPILGHGISTGQYLSPLRGPSGAGYTPHNDYIRFLAEQGVIGLALFLAFLGAQGVYLWGILRSAPKGSSEGQLCLILIAFLISNLVNMLSNNVLDIGDFWFYWWAVFPVAGWGTERFQRVQEC
jgi:O-antigen ligase